AGQVDRSGERRPGEREERTALHIGHVDVTVEDRAHEPHPSGDAYVGERHVRLEARPAEVGIVDLRGPDLDRTGERGAGAARLVTVPAHDKAQLGLLEAAEIQGR